MNIKRCVKCGKPLRADAEYCKRCGHRFVVSNSTSTPTSKADTSAMGTIRSLQPAETKSRHEVSLQGRLSNQQAGFQATHNRPLRSSTQKPQTDHVSTPPASPHRAGHYSGLHPEDQPYQSSFMAVLRPPVPVVLSPSPEEQEGREVWETSYPQGNESPPDSQPLQLRSAESPYSKKREESPSNPNATWQPTPAMPKSESEQEEATLPRLARPQASPRPFIQYNAADTEQENQDECDLPTSPLPLPSQSHLPASSNPNAIWMPKAEKQPEPLVLHPRAATASPSLRREERLKYTPPRSVDSAPLGTASSPYATGLISPPALSPDPEPGAFSSYVPVSRNARMRGRVIPILLTISCLLFLVATSLLASVFLSKKVTFTATPNTNLRVGDTFTLAGTGFGADDPINFHRDKNIPILSGNHRTDALGSFTVQITISSDWAPGLHTIYVVDDNLPQLTASTHVTIKVPPVGAAILQLQQQPSNRTIDFGPGDPGTVSMKSITLTNSGGGQVAWKANSDENWLTAVPSQGTFFGSQAVTLMVNRSLPPAQAYSGHITFIQQGGAARSFMLFVTMSISAPPAPDAFLVLSTPSLSFNAITAQSPPSQTITLQNSGGRPLNWSATAVTGDGAPWLSLAPNHGYLAVNATSPVTVSIQSQRLPVGTYTGTVSFQGGANPQLALSVSLSIVAPALLSVSSSSLSLQAFQGKQAGGQITIQDTGGQPLDWTLNSSVANGTNWLTASPASGHLNPAGTQNITVVANAGALAASSYQGTLTFSYGTSTKQVPVVFTVSEPPAPSISLQPSSLVFNATQGINPPAQTFTITNTGNAPLNWKSTEDANGTTYAATSSSSSTSSLAPGKSITITVTPKVSTAAPGTIPALIIVSDSDKGSTVAQQQVTLTINISSAAIVTASPGNMAFNQSATLSSSAELLTIDNTGSAPLNWSLAQGGQTPASWLSVDTTSGTVAPGTTFTVNVTCNSSQLTAGTYTATLIVSDSDPNSPVLSQTVTVTLVVG